MKKKIYIIDENTIFDTAGETLPIDEAIENLTGKKAKKVTE